MHPYIRSNYKKGGLCTVNIKNTHTHILKLCKHIPPICAQDGSQNNNQVKAKIYDRFLEQVFHRNDLFKSEFLTTAR